jgi:2,3-dihydroxybiphenyl 1,2-dioxygenase
MQLGQLGFEVSDMAAWETLLADVLGLVPVGDGRWRNDGHAWRFQLTEGPADDLSYVSWECTSDELRAVLDRLRRAGVPVTEADPAVRDVAERWVFADPAGNPTELTTGNARAATPFASAVVPDGFIADDLGLGHVVLSTGSKAESARFYAELLGARLSDHIQCTFFGYPVDLSFFHLNPRHHSVAFGGPQPKRLNHFLLEAHSMDAVGLAYDRCLRAGVPIHLTLGKHPNDQMFRFYAHTPSGFQFEFGWGGLQVDDATWQPTTHDRISAWGHHPPSLLAPRKKR